MNKKILLWEIVGAIFVIIMGGVFHFAFDWLGQWKPAALIFAVNESIWEHNKIGFWPAVIFAVVEFFFIGKYNKNFFYAKAIQLLLIPTLIMSLFYTYTGIIGYDTLVMDLIIFVIAVVVAQVMSYRILKKESVSKSTNIISIVIIAILIVTFSTLTYFPPHIPLFKDSGTGKYGI